MTNRRLFWQIVDKIESIIDAGVYSAGSRLPPERELATTFKVSRPTVREAIIALEVRGKVEVKTGSGVYVIEPASQAKNSAPINAFELTQARALIEGEVVAIAATTISPAELEQLHQTLVDMKQGVNVEQADCNFHKIIAHSTHNNAMIISVENLWNLRTSTTKIINDYNSVCSTDKVKTIAEHTAIYQALKSRDATKARIAMHNHFSRLINALFDAVEERALEEIRQKSSEKRDLYSIKKIVKS